MIIMDNASFHHSDRIEEICVDAGVKLLYLLPYSPELNPIGDFLGVKGIFFQRY